MYQDGNLLLEMGDEEVYFAYLLYLGAEQFGTINPPSEKLNDFLAERAISDWLKNFRPDKWTYKRQLDEKISDGEESTTLQRVVVEDISPKMLQMTEMLASLMTRKAMKSEIQTKLL